MTRGKPNKQYTGEFKQQVVEDMIQNRLAHRETARKYEINNRQVLAWERIYLEEGAAGLYIERRGRTSNLASGRKPNQDKKVEEDLIAENQRLRAEVDYLKKLNALVAERVRREKNLKS